MSPRVTRLQILGRGLSNRCPNCGERTLFKAGTLFQVNRACPNCGLVIERDEGFFLGSLSLNYGVTVVCFLVPIFLLAYAGAIGTKLALALAGGGALILPALLYRSSRSWWLMNYYFVMPRHLPANRTETAAGDDPNT